MFDSFLVMKVHMFDHVCRLNSPMFKRVSSCLPLDPIWWAARDCHGQNGPPTQSWERLGELHYIFIDYYCYYYYQFYYYHYYYCYYYYCSYYCYVYIYILYTDDTQWHFTYFTYIYIYIYIYMYIWYTIILEEYGTFKWNYDWKFIFYTNSKYKLLCI